MQGSTTTIGLAIWYCASSLRHGNEAIDLPSRRSCRWRAALLHVWGDCEQGWVSGKGISLCQRLIFDHDVERRSYSSAPLNILKCES